MAEQDQIPAAGKLYHAPQIENLGSMTEVTAGGPPSDAPENDGGTTAYQTPSPTFS